VGPTLWVVWRLRLVVVVDQVRMPLSGVATKKAVEPLEPPAQRPTIIRPCGSLLVARRQMPLSHHEGAVAPIDQDLRQHAVLERNDAVVAGISGRQLRDAGHPVGMVVPPGDDARAARAP